MQKTKVTNGTVKISNDIILNITGLAALDIDGVAEVIGFRPNTFSDAKSSVPDNKGIKLEIRDKRVFLELSIIVKNDVRIPEVAHAVQSAISNQIKVMTGLDVDTVNVTVSDICK